MKKRMKIPFIYYLMFWIKNTLMAIATGFVIGFIMPIIPFGTVDGMFFGFIIYQIAACRYFLGSKRGYFEFRYIENMAEKKLAQLVKKRYGLITYLRYFFDSLNNMSSFQQDLYNKLYNNSEMLNNDDAYLILLKLAYFAQKEKNYSKEFELLNKAFDKKPEGFLPNYKLALSFEKSGSIEKAINHYQLALSDKHLNSKQLSLFVYDKILKLKENNTFV